MVFQDFAGAAYRAVTARKDGPSLYDVCDPLLLNSAGGDAHLAKFYKTALGNPALRPLRRRTGLCELTDPARLQTLREALMRARDDAAPDWAAIGQPVAALLDTIELRHPQRRPAGQPSAPPDLTSSGLANSDLASSDLASSDLASSDLASSDLASSDLASSDLASIARVIRICSAHLLRTFGKPGFIPAYAAFNLIGDPDLRGCEFLMALTGLNARGYKNSTLLFHLARIFIARSPARCFINPPWKGIAEPMWQPMQIRHRSAYYDAFFTEALLSFVETGLASPEEAGAARRAIAQMVDFCLVASREEVRGPDGRSFNVITAIAPPPHPRFSRFFTEIKQNLGFGVYVPDCDTTA